MSLITVDALSYVRLRVPDLCIMEEFLTHFGLVRASKTSDALYMRGTDGNQYLHISETGHSDFIAVGLRANSLSDLEVLARSLKQGPIEKSQEPGGGHRLRLKDPCGFVVEVIHGVADAASQPARSIPHNSVAEPIRRRGRGRWLPNGPPRVHRIGHIVFFCQNVSELGTWYRDVLGLLETDLIFDSHTGELVQAFYRLNHGEVYVDHHILMLLKSEKPGFHHVSFEVQDLDEVFNANAYLKNLGKYKLLWEGGRHGIGGHVGSYWADPWGCPHEIWSDADRLNASDPVMTFRNTVHSEGPRWHPAPEEFLRSTFPKYSPT
jgi:catechol 2,3-dioxygenase-like lactoylglutathione lyase family enzyme